jgi:MbtH protein
MFDDERREFHVVINHEEQYSIWPADRDIPAGWHTVGSRGTTAECFAYIDQVWTDMRPLTLRRQMAADRRRNGRGVK